METDDNQLCLKWHNFKENFMSQFGFLKDEEEFVDVTLSCGGKYLRAHKVVLSASSPYLKGIFKENPCKHPVIILDDMNYAHLEALLAFIYTGQVNVSEAELPAFLDSANLLQIRGLSEPGLTTTDQPSLPINELPSATTATRKRVAPANDTLHPPPAPKIQASRRISRPALENEIKKEENLSEGEVSESSWPQTEPERSVRTQEWEQEYGAGDGRRRHSLDPRPCPLCNRLYSNLSNLRQHLRLIHNPQVVTCQLCSKNFKTDLYLRRHIMSYHENGLAADPGGRLPTEMEMTNEAPSYHP